MKKVLLRRVRKDSDMRGPARERGLFLFLIKSRAHVRKTISFTTFIATNTCDREMYDEIQAERRQALEERAGNIDSCLNVTEQLLQEGNVTQTRITEVISSYEPKPNPGRVPIPR